MKKFGHLTLFSLAGLLHVEAKDISNRVFLPYISGGFVWKGTTTNASYISKYIKVNNFTTVSLDKEFLCQTTTCNISI